ncbi:MAG: protein N-terminal glutamine amidohydrolase [Lentisphaeraceae bacterium]|nr:protein N-terminal glutamine amidohydrolase [Lentisphaeraceae bacterium]
MASNKYTAFFCEENIWHMLNDMNETDQRNTSILFISNEYNTCALLNQRAAKTGEYIVWDYHLILHKHSTNEICDYDTVLNPSTDINEYFALTFGNQSLIHFRYRSLILSIPGNEYLAKFSSDRSHMLDANGDQVRKFPDWPPILNKGGFTLKDLMSLNKKVLKAYKLYSTEEYLKI